MIAHASTPTAAAERLTGLDAVRGVALLGILLANVRQLFLPFDLADLPVALPGVAAAAWAEWSFCYALVDLKFLTLFSLLFGIGFALQGERLARRGERFGAIYLRRVAILAGFGLVHGLLLYPAEVLLPYALTALALLPLRRYAPDTLLRVGLVLLGTTVVWHYQIGSLGRIRVDVTVAAIAAQALALLALRRQGWRVALGAWGAVVLVAAIALTGLVGPGERGSSVAAEYAGAQQQWLAVHGTDPAAWPDEYDVRRDGSFAALLGLHARQYAMILVYFAILLAWRTLGLFLIGGALFRKGLLEPATAGGWRRVAAIGLGIGLPLSLLATAGQAHEILGLSDWRLPEFLHAYAAIPLAAGIGAAVLVAQQGGRARALWSPLEAAGQMALTNYVGQSLLMAALAEPWGFGLYARIDAPWLTLLALAVFAACALASRAWLRHWRMGPLEWLWRCGTYGRRLPNRIAHGAAAA